MPKSISLPSSLYSVSQVYSVQRFIKIINEEVIKKKFEGSDNLSKINFFDENEYLNYFINSESSIDDLSLITKKLSQLLETYKRITIVLSDIPSEDFKTKLVKWFRSIESNLFIDFKVDTGLIGGILIDTPNKKIDLSFRDKLGLDKEDYLKVINVK
jgi:F0F1-type ATP synthase delta subunit